MPTNAKLATPATKSKSMTNLNVDEDQLAQVEIFFLKYHTYQESRSYKKEQIPQNIEMRQSIN